MSRTVLSELFPPGNDAAPRSDGCVTHDQRRLAGAILNWALEVAGSQQRRTHAASPCGSPPSTAPSTTPSLGVVPRPAEPPLLEPSTATEARCGAVVVPPLQLQLPSAPVPMPSSLTLSPPAQPMPSPSLPPPLPALPPAHPGGHHRQQLSSCCLQQQHVWRMPRQRKMSLSESPFSTVALGLEQCDRPRLMRKLVELLRSCSDRRLTRALRRSEEWAWLSSMRVGAELIVSTCCALVGAMVNKYPDMLLSVAHMLTEEAHLVSFGVSGVEVSAAVVGVYGLRRLLALLIQLRAADADAHQLTPTIADDERVCKELSRALLCLSRAHCAAQRHADSGSADGSASSDINFAAPNARALSTQGEELLECATALVRGAPALGSVLLHRVVKRAQQTLKAVLLQD